MPVAALMNSYTTMSSFAQDAADMNKVKRTNDNVYLTLNGSSRCRARLRALKAFLWQAESFGRSQAANILANYALYDRISRTLLSFFGPYP